MKKSIWAAMAASLLACTFVLTGCQGGGTGEDKSLDKVKEKGVFVLGLDDSFPPMGYRDDKNEIVGFDVDVAREACKRMGVELKLQSITWTEGEMELNSGKVDCLWNGMSVDEERKAAMNLSESYMDNRMVVVVLGDSSYKTLAELKDKKIAVQNGSTAQKILDADPFSKTLKEIVPFKENVTAFMDLEAGGVDCMLVDEIVVNEFISTQKKNYRVLDEALQTEEYAVGFRKADQALRDEVQKALTAMKKDGKLAEISTKWFGKDVTTVK